MEKTSEGGGPAERRTSGLAVASLVLGIAGVCLCGVGILPGMVALILGIVALTQIRAGKEALGGAGMAIAGIVTGVLSVVLLPFVLIVAAIAIPALVQARAASGEAVAVASLRSYASAQYTYRRTDHDGDGVYEYACPYVELYATEEGGMPIGLIDEAFANASRDDPPGGATGPKAGYGFVDIGGEEGGEAYDDGKGNFEMSFGLCAVPSEYGKTGRNTFIIGADCTIYRKDTGGEPVTQHPSLDEEGWVPVEF